MARIEAQQYTLSSKETILVRNAMPDDANDIIKVMTSVFDEREYHLSVPEDFKVTEEEQRKSIEKFLDDPGKLMLVADTGGSVVAIMEFDNDYRQRLKHRGTVWMSVLSEMRDRDLGTVLGMHGWKWVFENPVIEKVYMHVLDTNQRSLGLCRKLGFIEEARLKKDVKLGPGQYADLVILSRFIREPSA